MIHGAYSDIFSRSSSSCTAELQGDELVMHGSFWAQGCARPGQMLTDLRPKFLCDRGQLGASFF